MAKRHTQDSVNKRMTTEWNLCLDTMKAKATQEQKEQQEHIQQVTHQNATLVAMIQEQQKKIKQLITASKNLLEKMAVDIIFILLMYSNLFIS